MKKARLKRVMTAVEEFAEDDMMVERLGIKSFDVKGYTVHIGEGTCSCPDHDYNEQFCKHLAAAALWDLWSADDAPTDKAPEPTTDGGPLSVDYTGIPSLLTTIDAWLVWGGLGDKNAPVPYNPETGEPADSLSDGVQFTRAKNIHKSGTPPTDGLMYIASGYDPFTVEQYETVRDPESGAVAPELEPVIESPVCHTDVAPNGVDVNVIRVEGESTDDEIESVPITGRSVEMDDVAASREEML